MSLLLSETSDLHIQSILELNKLVKEIRANAAQKLRFFKFDGNWRDMAIVQYADASSGNRHGGYSTGGLLTCLAPKEFREGEESELCTLGWRFPKLPHKAEGSNGGES